MYGMAKARDVIFCTLVDHVN